MDRKPGTERCVRGIGATVALLLWTGVAFAADAEGGEAGWTGEVAASITAQSGTTDTFAGLVDARTTRAWEKDSVGVGFTGTYGTSRKRDDSKNTEVIQNSQRIFGDWKHTIHERYFWQSDSFVERDTTQDLEVRLSIASGPGYRLWRGENVEKEHFDVMVGPGYRFEIYDGNTGGTIDENGDTDHYVDVVAGFEYKNMLFDDRVEYAHTGSARMPANDTSSYLLRSEIVVGVPITESWSFRTAFLVEYVASPGSDEVNNTTTRTSVGLGYKF